MSRNAKLGLGLCLGLTALLAVMLCCGLLVVAAAGGWLFYQQRRPSPAPVSAITLAPPTAVPAARHTPTPTPAASATPLDPPAAPSATPADTAAAADQASRLAAVTMEPRDLRLLAQELQGGQAIPATVAAQGADYPLGTTLDFNVSNEDDSQNPNFVVSARLAYKTDNVYFFAERGLRVDLDALRQVVDDFQNKTYPTNRRFFGSEWLPGVDGDQHLYILYARGLGFSIGGYYSPLDEYSHLAHPYSNEKEMFYINADTVRPNGSEIASTLAHEFQHMIRWNQDRNEDIWFNEGASMLAEQLNGYAPADYAGDYLVQPDLQLNAWTDGDTLPHYGAAYLFLAYFLDRFGEAATQALMNSPLNGLAAVDATLAEIGQTDPATGQPLTTDDFMADWAAANGVNDTGIADGRYGYRVLSAVPTAEPADTLARCPVPARAETVAQFGTDYYDLTCAGTYQLTFAGAAQVPVVPADPASGQWAFWSNRGDESVSTLTHAFDLTGLSTATLAYSAWWDIEENYDYAYVLVSTDAGQTWEIQRAPGMTDANPQGANFGWGYTGRSAGWQTEQVDLSAYAGRPILVRFEYITDAGLNLNGLLIDDVRVPELNYQSDLEQDDGGWQAAGFTRLENALPQKFAVQLIRQSGGQTTVERLPLDAANHGTSTLTLNRGDRVRLAVTGLTRFTTEPAEYRFALTQP